MEDSRRSPDRFDEPNVRVHARGEEEQQVTEERNKDKSANNGRENRRSPKERDPQLIDVVHDIAHIRQTLPIVIMGTLAESTRALRDESLIPITNTIISLEFKIHLDMMTSMAIGIRRVWRMILVTASP
jgi:hypothetical protein